MKKFVVSLVAFFLVMGLAMTASAGSYYEFSSYGGSGTEYDVACYGNTIYYGAGASVYSIDVSVADPSKKNEPYYLSDGITPNPNYQTRLFSNPQAITLNGHPTALNGGSVGEMYVDAANIYTTAGDKVYAFNKNTGVYQSTVVTGGGITGTYAGYAHFLSYGGGKWWTGNEDRQIWSSTGGVWTYEFIFNPTTGGSHGDGMEYVNGYVFVSDMTSNYIAQWENVGGVWIEKEVFDYNEIFGGSSKYVEGMGFGALDHFWAGSGSVVYELGGGDIQQQVNPVPEPCTMILFGTGIAGVAGFLRKRSKKS
ncbi:MAG: PEP-CTERM sorting domain-containing protein [Thermodesulfobacteriota bacterium]